MSKTISEIRAEREAAAFEEALHEKVAEVREVLGDDDQVLAVLDEALDLVNENGEADNPIDALEKAAAYTYHYFTQGAESEEAEDGELSKEAQAEIADAYELGKFAAAVAHDAGVTSEDIDNMSPAQAEEFGRFLAHAVDRAAEELEG